MMLTSRVRPPCCAAGPVGFGDALPGDSNFSGTNITRLLLASRQDSIILKPAHPVFRLDLALTLNASVGAAPLEIWAAPTLPAAADATLLNDGGCKARRANSFVRLQSIDGVAATRGSRQKWSSAKSPEVTAHSLPCC